MTNSSDDDNIDDNNNTYHLSVFKSRGPLEFPKIDQEVLIGREKDPDYNLQCILGAIASLDLKPPVRNNWRRFDL
jgi:hypothetical protein